MTGHSRQVSHAISAAMIIAFVILPVCVSAEQSPRILAYVVAADRLKAHIAPTRKALRGAFGAKRVWFLPEDLDCDPESDIACASSLETKNRAAAIVIVRIHWARAGCQPMYNSAGKRSGHRMLQRPQAQVIALQKGKVIERVTISKVSTTLDEEIDRALKALAAKKIL